jgi:hypothetical protein
MPRAVHQNGMQGIESLPGKFSSRAHRHKEKPRMEKESTKLELTLNPDDVMEALEAASNDGLLCGPCTEKLGTQITISQSDFCRTCQDAVNAQLASIVENRIKNLLVRMRFPSDSVEIPKN